MFANQRYMDDIYPSNENWLPARMDGYVETIKLIVCCTLAMLIIIATSEQVMLFILTT